MVIRHIPSTNLPTDDEKKGKVFSPYYNIKNTKGTGLVHVVRNLPSVGYSNKFDNQFTWASGQFGLKKWLYFNEALEISLI